MTIQKVADFLKSNEQTILGGGTIDQFEHVGRDAFTMMINHGLLPEHKVLDFACGSLRIGYWLIRFLDTDNYCGIEPNKAYVEESIRVVCGDDLIEFKKPKFHYSTDCNISHFGENFNYAVARSFLTHTPISLLDKFLANVATSGVETFFASYWPEGSTFLRENKVARPAESFDIGDTEYKPITTIRQDTLDRLADEHALSIVELPRRPLINGQVWLKITPA